MTGPLLPEVIVIADAVTDGRRWFGVVIAEFPVGTRRELLRTYPAYEDAIRYAENIGQRTDTRVIDAVGVFE